MFLPLLYLFLTLCGMIIVFLTMCIVCDCFLVPVVEILIEKYQVPEELAAITLIAFSSAAPEITLNVVSAYEGSANLSLPACLGSALIAFGLIPPCSILFTSHNNATLLADPIMRETCLYLLSLSVFMWISYDNEITLNESMGLVSIYLCYVSLIFTLHHLKPDVPTTNTNPPSRVSSGARLDAEETVGLMGGEASLQSDGRLNPHCPTLHEYYERLSKPMQQLISFGMVAIGDDMAAVTLSRALLAILVCIVWVGFISSIIIQLCQSLVLQLGVESTTLGATLVALGSEIPDTVSSIALAKSGHFDAAMAGSIGSQVVTITIGVGLPAVVMCLTSATGAFQIKGGHTHSSLMLLTLMVYIVIGGYLAFTLPLKRIFCKLITFFFPKVGNCFHMNVIQESKESLETTTISRNGAHVQLGVWVFVFFGYIYMNETE